MLLRSNDVRGSEFFLFHCTPNGTSPAYFRKSRMPSPWSIWMMASSQISALLRRKSSVVVSFVQSVTLNTTGQFSILLNVFSQVQPCVRSKSLGLVAQCGKCSFRTLVPCFIGIEGNQYGLGEQEV